MKTLKTVNGHVYTGHATYPPARPKDLHVRMHIGHSLCSPPPERHFGQAVCSVTTIDLCYKRPPTDYVLCFGYNLNGPSTVGRAIFADARRRGARTMVLTAKTMQKWFARCTEPPSSYRSMLEISTHIDTPTYIRNRENEDVFTAGFIEQSADPKEIRFGRRADYRPARCDNRWEHVPKLLRKPSVESYEALSARRTFSTNTRCTGGGGVCYSQSHIQPYTHRNKSASPRVAHRYFLAPTDKFRL